MRAHFAWMCAALALVTSGCSLDRVSVDGQGIDGGPRPDSGPPPELDGGGDSGRECTPGSCDDGNVCTNDTCGATGCVFAPVPSACDDGVLCNGGDSCMDGACTVHDGVDPCAGSSTCDPATDSCTGCVNDTDCPEDTVGDFGACMWPSEVCAITGSRSRTVRSYTCSGAGTCDASDRMEMEACMRSTDGVGCGAETAGPWSPCSFATMCTTDGTQTRTVATPRCGSGVCGMMTRTETQACTRPSTDGQACGSDTCNPWSPCFGDELNECSGPGAQLRACGIPICSGGSCSTMHSPPTARVERQNCTLGTGSGCGVSVSGCGACIEEDGGPCSGEYGVRTCTMQTGVCMGGGGCTPDGASLGVQVRCRCGGG